MTIAALAMALGAIGAGPAFADDTPGTSQPRKAKADTARKICRVMTPTGSRMTSRIASPGTEVFEMYGPGKDGKEMKMMEITYTKK